MRHRAGSINTRVWAGAVIACASLHGPRIVQGQPVASQRYAFDADEDLEACAVVATGEAKKRMPAPKVADGRLYLLESWWKSTASVACPAPTDRLARIVDVSFDLIMNTGTEGAGFAWLDAATHGGDGPAPEVERWEAPSIARAFGVGFDASNPPNRDPFRGSGNVYDRPQHEVSLHWDGREIVKRTTPMDFRDEEPHRVRVRIESTPGGAEVDVWIDERAIYKEFFIATMTPFIGRPALGATNVETAGDVMIDDLSIDCLDAIDAPSPPLTVTAIDGVLNDKDRPRSEATVDFPDDTDEFARIVCTLRLDRPETRFDPWDRLAHLFVYDDEGERYEVLRYITPYDRGGVWHVDVTDLRPLLRGRRRIEQACTTYGEGWVVTVRFDFFPGQPDRLADRVINLWSGAPEIGNPEKPAGAFFVPRAIPLDEGVTGGRVRMIVTGHGMSPNTNNAAEFMPLGRTLTVNGERHSNELWKSDNYLNPCRPQGGTWKYDRAGWAPGDVVRPWEVDVSHLVDDRRELRIEYALDAYVNENRGQTWAPFHQTEAQLILYRFPSGPDGE